MSIEQNATDQWLEFLVLNAGEPVTGLDQSEFTITYSINNGTAGSYTLSDGSLNDPHAEGLIVELGGGKYHLGLKDASLTAVGLLAHSIVCATSGNTAIPNTIRIVDPDVFKADVSNLGTSAGLATIQSTQAAHTASLSSLSSSVSSVLAKMLAYFRLALRSDSGPTTDDAVELAEINGDGGSGAGDYDRTNSQEGIRDNQSGGGGGGEGTTLVVSPVAGVITQRSQRADFELFRGEQRDNVVAVIDAAGVAVDLSGLTLRVVIEDGRSTDDIQAIEDGDISVSGDDNNVITFRNDPAVTASRRTLNWSLWSTGTNLAELLIRGEIKVVSVSQ